jgi:hypothetical protein
MTIAVLGIDLAKHVFQLHGVDAHGRAVVSKRVSRAKLVETVVQLAPRAMAMEACCGAHYWGRRFRDLGLEHRAIVTGSGRKAAQWSPFKWVNTTLGSIKAAITGTYRQLTPAHAGRYLASFALRYNRRLLGERCATILAGKDERAAFRARPHQHGRGRGSLADDDALRGALVSSSTLGIFDRPSS